MVRLRLALNIQPPSVILPRRQLPFNCHQLSSPAVGYHSTAIDGPPPLSFTIQPPSVVLPHCRLRFNRRRLPLNRRRLSSSAVGYHATAVSCPAPPSVTIQLPSVVLPCRQLAFNCCRLSSPTVGHPPPPSVTIQLPSVILPRRQPSAVLGACAPKQQKKKPETTTRSLTEGPGGPCEQTGTSSLSPEVSGTVM